MFQVEMLQSNFTTVIMLLFFVVFMVTNHTLDKKMSRIFMNEVAIAALLILVVCVDYWCAQKSTPMVLRYITTATGYTFRPIVMMIMVEMFTGQNNKLAIIYRVMIAVNGLLAYSSYFTKIVYYFDATNEFQRGPLGMTPFIVSGFFLVALIGVTVYKYRAGNRKEMLVVFMIAVVNTVCVILESIFKYHYILNGGIVISIVFYYMYLHVQTYKRDALTGALNRHAFYIDSEKLNKQSMVIISIDMNDLKKINDIQGHTKGDEAIKIVSGCIAKRLKVGAYFYRVGGDEFVVLLPKLRINEAGKLMEEIVNDMKRTSYTIAYGMAEYEPDRDFEKVYALSDGRMYEMKHKMKKLKEGTN